MTTVVRFCIWKRLWAIGLAVALQTTLFAKDPFGIQFIDQQTSRPVPLVEIETVDHVRMVSDNNGWISIDDPELLDTQVFFHIRSHGYEYPKDGFGFAGKTISCTSGQRVSDRRVLATQDAYVDPTRYQGFTCLQEGTVFEDRKIDRNSRGEIVYRWRHNTLPLTQSQEKTLVEEKLMSQSERRYRMLDTEHGQEVQAHNGSVVWNPYRNAWSMVFTQYRGDTSVLGEIWYAESKRLEGPWKRAKKIATHHQYSFYNPKIHPEFVEQNGKILYFEGTYTTTFSGNSHPTPRYDYNQILYRLDLDLLSGLNFED